MNIELTGGHLLSDHPHDMYGMDPEVASDRNSNLTSEIPDSDINGVDMRFPADVDIAEIEVSKSIALSAPAAKRHRRKQGKNDNNNNALTSTQSRARPRKSFEPQPFLSVDNVKVGSGDKKVASSQNHKVKHPSNNGKRLPWGSFDHPGAPSNTPAPLRSAGSKRGGMARSRGSTPNANSKWNPMVPKQDRLLAAMLPDSHHVNHHLKTPFKHAVKQQQSATKRVPSPSLDMKQKTIIATQQMARMISKQPVEHEERIQGRLLKGRLKPLNVVKVDGPAIQHCKGIVSDSKNYDTVPSRTLQRRRQLVAGLLRNNDYDRPQTGDSRHHTSIASDLSENRLDEVIPDIEELEQQSTYEHPQFEEIFAPEYDTENNHQNDKLKADEWNAVIGACPNQDIPKDEGVPNLESASDTFFATEDDENNYDCTAKPEKSLEDSRPTSGASARSILKELPSRPVSRGRRIGSAGDATRFQDNEPNTDQDPKKAVRFAEEDTVAIISARNRSKSAMPRLSSQIREKGVKSGSCKPDDILSKKDDDDDNTEPDCAGDRTKRSNSWTVSQRTGSAASNKTSNTGAKHSNSGKQITNKAYDTRDSLDSVVFSKEGVSKTSLTPRPPSASKVRSRLGAWEDLCKPDSDITLLAIKGSNVEADPDVLEMKHLVSYDFLAFNSISFENSVTKDTTKKRKVYKGRPASAHEFNRTARNHVIDERDKINAVKYRRTAGVVPRSAGSRRPMSGIRIANTQSGLKVSVNNSQFETDFKLLGNQVTQSVKPGICCRCKIASDDCCYLDETGGKLVCLTCFNDLDKERRMQLKDHLLKSIQQDEGDELSGDPVDIDEYITGLERELERRAKHTEKKLSTTDSKNEVMQDKFMSTLELLEQSLNTVQADIRSCMEPDEQPAGYVTQALVPVECNSAVDYDLGYSSERDEDPGQISKILTDNEAFELDRYRQKIQERKNLRSRPGSGTIRSRPNSGQSTGTRPKSGVSSRLNSAHSSGIGSADPQQAPMSEDCATQTVCPTEELSVVPNQRSTEETESADTDSVLEDGDKPVTSVPESEGVGLSVVATSATINTRSEEEDNSPIAPYPPLCFRLNSRPPPGHLYYFAYGLNMNHDRMCNTIKRDIQHRLWGLLFGFNLAFNKRGIDSEAGGFPNVEFNSTSSVEGVVYLIRQEELLLLDSAMGYPQHYEHVMLPVWMCNCDKPDDYGVAQYCVPALVYIAQDNYIYKGGNLSCEYSVDQCLKGSADILTPQYRQFLQTLAQLPSSTH